MRRNPGKLVETGESIAFTFSGRRVQIAAPKSTEILAADIAEQLAKAPMFRGATRGLYTIAQHNSMVAKEVARAHGPRAGLYALLESAERVYSESEAHQAKLQAAIHRAFGLAWPMPAQWEAPLAGVRLNVKLTELIHLCTGCDAEIALLQSRGAKPLGPVILPLGWDRAHERYVEFLRTFVIAAAVSPCPAMEGLL